MTECRFSYADNNDGENCKDICLNGGSIGSGYWRYYIVVRTFTMEVVVNMVIMFSTCFCKCNNILLKERNNY